jgi:hypothetical protein
MSLRDVIPANPKQPYNMKDIITRVVDDGHFFEVQKRYAQNMITGFARLGGYSVGVVANNPRYLAGCLDIDASVKCSRFVLLRRLQHPPGHLRGRARVPARRGPGHGASSATGPRSSTPIVNSPCQ